MLKIHQHFARNYILTFIVAIICVAFISYLTLENFYINSLKSELKSIIKVIKPQVKISQNLQLLAEDISKSTDIRVTFIDINGTVLGESHYDYKAMDNHINRPEIQVSMVKNFGVDMRLSKTLKGDFLYTSHKINDKLFIRLSISTNNIQKSFLSLWYKIIFIFILALVISIIFSYFINKKIQIQIKNIYKKLDLIANKNYKSLVRFSFAQEFLDISNSLNDLAKKISKKDKQKRKNSAKLKLLNKQRFQTISAISHEFKNPLASIIGYTNTILEDENIDQQSKVRFLNKILSNANKINFMIDRFALSVKLENNDLKPVFTKFDLSELTIGLVEDFKTRFKDRDFKLDIEQCFIKADSTFMEIIITNLLDNAVKYSQEEIIIKLKNGEFSIIDFGKGLPEEEINKVTKKFYRTSQNSWDNSMGLGLAIVSYMLKLHNTKLQIKSKLSYGSTFSFKLKNTLENIKKEDS